jgi:hypothetical protein
MFFYIGFDFVIIYRSRTNWDHSSKALVAFPLIFRILIKNTSDLVCLLRHNHRIYDLELMNYAIIKFKYSPSLLLRICFFNYTILSYYFC